MENDIYEAVIMPAGPGKAKWPVLFVEWLLNSTAKSEGISVRLS